MRIVQRNRPGFGVLTFRVYEGEEVSRDISPICARIFHADDRGMVTDDLPQIFRDPRWKVVLVTGSIRIPYRYGFMEEAGATTPPEDLAWMFPSGCPEELVPFFDLLRAEGCEEVYHLLSFRPNRDALGCPPIYEAQWFTDGDIVFEDRVLFDRSATWGLYSSPEQYMLIGGEPDLMDRYAARLGGWANIRRCADLYWGELYRDNPNDPYRPVPHLYRQARWDFPFPPPTAVKQERS